jgi:acetyltransferase-like isoleucine patch superfamily enzyme
MIYELQSKLMKPADYLSVGRYSYGAPKVLRFPSEARLKVGSFCSIADEVTILLGGNHDSRRISTYPFNALWEDDGLPTHETTRGDVELGSDVWVGYGATILSGVKIGDGAVVAACAVVSRDVPPYAVVAGNPAEVKRYRFREEEIEALLTLRWWDWPLELIRESAADLMGHDVFSQVIGGMP